MESWVPRMVKTRSRRRVVAWCLVVVCALWLGFAQRRYLGNFLSGPFEIGAAELDAITDVAETPRYFVKVTGTKALDTGIQQITVRKRGGVEVGRSVSGRYYGLAVGEKILLCKGTGLQTVAEGELTTIPGPVQRELFGKPEMARLRSRFYPYLLASGSFRLPGYIAIGGVLLLGLLLLRSALPAWRHLRDPATHPLMRRMKSWEDPAGVSREAERAVRAPLYKGRGWRLTDAFLVRSTFFTFDLARLGDLAWAYKKVTKHSVNFIPTGRTFEVVLVFPGATFALKTKEKTVDGVLGFAAQKAPWAIFGFTPALKKLLATKPQELHAAVEERRRAWSEGASGKQAPRPG